MPDNLDTPIGRADRQNQFVVGCLVNESKSLLGLLEIARMWQEGRHWLVGESGQKRLIALQICLPDDHQCVRQSHSRQQCWRQLKGRRANLADE